MSILEILGLKKSSDDGKPPARVKNGGKKPVTENKVLKEIAEELSSLSRQEALKLAAYAYVLSRVAYVDLEINEAERAKISKLLQKEGGFSPDRAETVCKIATQKAKIFGATHDYLITREFSKTATAEEKRELLKAVFSVAAADGTITMAESQELRKITSELKLEREVYTQLRVAFREQLEENQS